VAHRLTIAVALASACTTADDDAIEPFLDSGKADGFAMKHLRKLSRHELDVEEPSDLAIVDGRLFTVSDRHSKIYEIDRSGAVRSERDIAARDLEALAFDAARGEFLVADEAQSRIWHIDAAGERRDSVDLEIDVDVAAGNNGIEGLAFDARGHLFVAKEKRPARIFELDGSIEVDREKVDGVGDLSALAFRTNDGRLYALSDEDQALYRLDSHLEVELAWHLPVDKPEGLAFDGDRIFIVSDSEQRLYELAFIEGR
jgi:uncharacterized protein YjiK